jgi:hypothetical protein
MSRRERGSEDEPLPHEAGASVRKLYWRLKALRDPAQQVLGSGITVSLTGAGFIGSPEVWTFPGLWWLVSAGVFLCVWLIGMMTFLRPTYAQLSREAAAAERDSQEKRDAIHRALEAVIRGIATHIYKDAVDCRISAYSVEGDEFVLLARVSANPLHERRGRPFYPLTVGTIGAAWAKNSAFDNIDAEDRAAWETSICQRSGFTREDAAKLTMLARSICAVRLDNGSDKVGVIVLESETFQQFGVAELKKMRASLLLSAATEIVAAAHTHFPRVVERKYERSGEPKAISLPEPTWKRAIQQVDPSHTMDD